MLGAPARLLCKTGVHPQMLSGRSEKTITPCRTEEADSKKDKHSENDQTSGKTTYIYRTPDLRQKVVTVIFTEKIR